MPNQHATNPISYRPGKENREWLTSLRDESGRAVNKTIDEAVTEARLHHFMNGRVVIHKDGDPPQ